MPKVIAFVCIFVSFAAFCHDKIAFGIFLVVVALYCSFIKEDDGPLDPAIDLFDDFFDK